MRFWFSSTVSHHVLRDHVLFGAILAALLSLWWGWEMSIVFWLASLLLDTDHYLDFVYHTGGNSWSIKEMLNFHARLFSHILKQDFLCIEIFHTFEFLAIFGLVAAWTDSPYLWVAFLGACFHILIDFVHLSRLGIFSKRANSFVEYFIRSRQMKLAGINIHAPYEKTLKDIAIARNPSS